MLQTPRTGGRSRFSKALPMPPPPQNTSETIVSPAHQIPRKLPELPAMANTTTTFPPRKSSAGAQFASKPIDAPLPALPAKPSETELQKKMPPIPRKAVASPPLSAQPAATEAVSAAKLKRNSSISSLLSAYSNTSSDSVHRSSQGSAHTKGSEASLSPERAAGGGDRHQNYTGQYKAYSRNPYEEPSAQEKEMMMHEPLPPPPPMKDASRPLTPRVGLPATPRNGRPAVASPPKDVDDASSQVTLTNASPPRREIWRRRASSKSDRSIAVSGLKLAISHGSTAAATAAVPAPETAPTQDLSSDSMSLEPSGSINKPSPPPPRTGPALPGRNVKPVSRNAAEVMMASPVPPTKDSPTLKSDAVPSSLTPGSGRRPQAAELPSTLVSPLSSPEPPAKSIRRREVAAKPSSQDVRANEANPAQHLREARSHIDLKAGRSEQVQREAAQENFPFEPPHPYEERANGGMPSPRSRRPSNASARRLAPALTVTSPTARAAPYAPVEYKDQEPMELTPQEEKILSAAINKVVNRNWDWAKATPNQQGVWPCKELTGDHISCISDHKRWLHAENLHNPLDCMLCHAGTREHRRVCKTCGIRVCIPCADLMTGRKIEELDFNALATNGKGKGVATAAA